MATIMINLSNAAVTRVKDAYETNRGAPEVDNLPPVDLAFVKKQLIQHLKNEIGRAEQGRARAVARAGFVDPQIT